jgi:uncharacterized protein (DUF58 family)
MGWLTASLGKPAPTAPRSRHSTQEKKLPDHSDGVHLGLEELLQYKHQCVKWLPPAKTVWASLLGQHQSRQIGRGMDFSEVRQYQPGDDVRTIDWRVTARTGKPHTKLFSEEREKPVIVYLDMSRTMHFGSTTMLKSVQAAHMASLLSWIAIAEKDRIGALIDTGEQLIELKPKSQQKGALGLLQAIVKQHNKLIRDPIPTSTLRTMEPALLALQRLSPKGSDIILISDFVHYVDNNQPLLRQLRRHNRVRLVHIYDPLEQGDTDFRGIECVSDHKQTRWLNFSSNTTRRGIKNAFESQKDKLELASQNMAISYSTLSSEISLLTQLSGKFK